MRNRSLHKVNLEQLPFKNYDYNSIYGACCENVVGYYPSVFLSPSLPPSSSRLFQPEQHSKVSYSVSLTLTSHHSYIPIPLGIAGPLLVNGKLVHIPMATTEGCLVASTHRYFRSKITVFFKDTFISSELNVTQHKIPFYRGCKAITSSNGATSIVVADGMTRGPAVRLPSAKRAAELMSWVKNADNFYLLASAFNSTSRFARLSTVSVDVKNFYGSASWR